MKRRLTILLFFSLGIVTLARFASNAVGGPTVAVLTDHMTIAEVEQAMLAYPPAAANVGPRGLIAKSMDKQVRLVRQEITNEQVTELQPLRDFYLRQVDRGLQELEQCRVTQGVRIFKFYSSSVVLKSKDGVVAMDFQQGPHLTAPGSDTPDPMAQKSGFHWTPSQLDRLAKLVDVSLITHWHSDHADYALTKRLLALGRPVVMPQQLRTAWSHLQGPAIVPAYGTAQKLGPVEILTTAGAQYMLNDQTTTDAAGLVTGYPSTDPKTRDAETVVYLARVGDLVFFQAAENNVPVYDWLMKAIVTGFRPDVKMSVGARQGGRSVGEAFKTMGPIFFLPIHEYEMGHANGGNRTAGYYEEARGEAIAKGVMMPLFWGENFALEPAALPWRNRAAAK